MIFKLVVPEPIEDVEEIRVLEWHGEIGRSFAPGDLIVELETYKALVEVCAGQPGTLRRILCETGKWQQVGKVLALFSDDTDEALPEIPDALKDMVVAFEVT